MSKVRYELEGRVAWITLDDPQTRNALSDELLDDLLAALLAAKADEDVRAVVLTSSHARIFSAGGDLKAFAGDASTIQKYAGLDRFPRLYTLIGGLGKPVLCAANGDVLAGALGLALACDLVIAKDSIRFGCPEINVGVFPFMISALIYRNVGRLKANALMMLGASISAAEALEFGLVNRVVPADQLDTELEALVARILGKPREAIAMGKALFYRQLETGMESAYPSPFRASVISVSDRPSDFRCWTASRRSTTRMWTTSRARPSSPCPAR